MIELRELSVNDDLDVYKMLQEIPKDENGYMNPVYGMTFSEFKSWLVQEYNSSISSEIIDGWKVPSSTYWLYIDNTIVGVGKLRHILTDKLRETGGHIGYSIRPSKRQKGLGTILLRELLMKANHMGIDNVLLTIQVYNIGSLKVALANGGTIEDKNDVRYFIRINCK